MSVLFVQLKDKDAEAQVVLDLHQSENPEGQFRITFLKLFLKNLLFVVLCRFQHFVLVKFYPDRY